MRVLHIFKIYYPEIFGGVQRVIYDISEGAADQGIKSRVFSLSKEPNPVPFPVGRHEAVTVKENLDIASTGLSFEAFGVFRREAAQADLLHFHFPWPFMDILYLASGTKKPSIVTYHSDIVKQSGLLHLYKPLMNRFLRRMDRIVATSPNYVETSPTLDRFRNKTAIVELGIPQEEVAPDPALVDQWRKRLGSGFFLFLGALRYYKALPVLLQAARKTGLPVVIGGTGTEEATLKAAAPANVHLIGHYTEEDRSALLSLALGFVFPSNQRSEAFGISLLEGARAGLPLICCEIGTGTTHVNLDGQTGLVVPPNDPDSLASAMRRLASEPATCARLGKGASARFKARFTAEKMSNAYFDIYRQVIAGQTP